ncbi:MAG TPA: tetratricopeptide repeat protein, partial [Oscillatoriaceae cyanobacterium]
ALFAWGWSLVRVGEEDAAMNVWKQGLDAYPSSRYAKAVRLALGNLLLARGDHLQASTYYNEAAREGNDEALMARAELLAGEAYADTRDFGLAISHYRSVPDDSPLREPAGYGIAWCTWQQGQLDDALGLFEKWISEWPQSGYRAAALYDHGAIEAQQGHMDTATSDWSRVVDLSPRSSWAEDALYQLGKAAFAADDYNGAVAYGRKLEDVFPRSRWLGPMLWMRGESYLAIGHYSDAIKAYSQLAVLGNQDFLLGQGTQVDFKIGMANFYAGNYGEAARVLETVESGPMADTALFWQAEARYRTGQYDQARALYTKLIDRSPHFDRLAEGYYGLGWSCYRLSDYAGARAAFAEASARLPQGRMQQDATFRWGLALIDMHEWDAARGIFAQLLAKSPEPDLALEARFQTAWSYYREDSLDSASKAFADFASTYPQSNLAPQALIWEGRSYFRQNNYAQAIAVLKSAIAHPLITPGQVYEAREQLAAAYHNSGDYDDARLIDEQLLKTPNLPPDRVAELQEGVVQAYLKAGEVLQAREAVLAHNPLAQADLDALSSIMQALYDKADWEQVIETFKAVPQPTDQETYWAGKAHLERQDDEGAIALLTKLRETQDQDLRSQALLDLAKAYRAKGDLALARDTLVQVSTAFADKPVAGDALLQAGDIAQAQHDDNTAETYYRGVAENHKYSLDQRRQAWMAIGDMHRAQREWGAALLGYRGAMGLGPAGSLGMALASYWAADVLVEMKDFKEAIHMLQGIQYPDKAEPLPSLAGLKQGEALEQLGSWHEAIDLYKRLAQIAPTTQAAEARGRLTWINANVPKEMR